MFSFPSRKCSALFATALIPLTLASCQNEGWESYTISEGNFTAEFPGEPTRLADALSEPIQLNTDGESATIASQVYRYENDELAYAVLIADLGGDYSNIEDSEAFLEEVLPQTLGSEAFITSKNIVYDNFSGKEFEATSVEGNLQVMGRMYLIGNRVYQLVASSPEDLVPEDVERFWESFEVDEDWLIRLEENSNGDEINENLNWETFSPADSGFSVQMPGNPEEKSTSDNYSTSTIYQVQIGDVGYATGRSVYNEDIDVSNTGAVIENIRSSFSQSEGGNLIRDEEASFNGITGRELEFEYIQRGYTMILRYYLNGNQLYQAAVYLPTEDRLSDNVSTFLDSFQVGI